MKQSATLHRQISPFHLMAWILAMATVLLLWISPFAAPPNLASAQDEPGHGVVQAAAGTVFINFNPQSPAVAKDQIFTVDIQIVAGTQQVDGAEVHIDFDPLYLQVVDSGGNPSSTIEPNTSALDVTVQNIVDNPAGHIDYAAGKLTGTKPSGTFVLATIRFKALSGTGESSTPLTFVSRGGNPTNVTFGGDSVLAGTTDGSVTISGPTPTGPPPTATRTPTLTRTPTATQTQIPTGTATPTITRTPVGPPTEIEFQDGRSPNMFYSGTEDTWLYWLEDNTPHGAIGEFYLRHDGLERPLIKFDVSEYIPYGSTIVEAQLHLWLDSKPAGIIIDADLYRVNRHWEESTATWRSPWHLPGCDGVPTDREGTLFATQRIRYEKQWITWDVTDLLRHWVSAPGNNEGVILIGRGEMAARLLFRSSDFTDPMHHPKLLVRFYAAPPTTTPTSTTTPTTTPTVPPPTPIPGDIEGLVWHDLNANGALDSGEPGLAGSSLRLYDIDHPPPEPPVRPAFVTGANGTFQFTDVPPGWYILTAAHPAGYGPTTINVVTVMVSSGDTTQANFGASTAALSSIFLPIILRSG